MDGRTCKRSSASSGPPVVLVSTRRASSRRPCMTSQRGDSGMASTAAARKTGGTAPARSMARQPRRRGSFAKAKLATYPRRTPKLPNTSGKDVSVPRDAAGESSAVVADPDSRHEAAGHQHGVVRGEAHHQRPRKEDGGRQHHGVAPPDPVRGAPCRQRAQQRVEVDDPRQYLDLRVRHLQVLLDEDLRPAHHRDMMEAMEASMAQATA
ncbi:hypothetical protein ACMD2_21230 [Ananas comosus]|uniref:Uncharacterized protein n=1 Tax=Ananas comosus TaxID=4615 RepID=A0A199VX33_ANACO|nr:hypothetical protein ACMD2_21230 [Ananas comosus]